MNGFWSDNGTKILGGMTAGLGTLQTFITTGAFDQLLSKFAIGWMGIILGTLTAVLGGATMARGFNNSSQVKIAEAMQEALNTPPPKQGGFALPKLLLALFLGCATVVSIGTMAGCTHTQAALKAADTPSDYALVFLEGYRGALNMANQLKDSGALAGSNLDRVRALELKAAPLVARIDPLRRAYEQTRSAADAQALQLAIDNALREAAEFIKAVQQARGV